MKLIKLLTFILIFSQTISSSKVLASLSLATYNIRNFDYDSRDDIHTNKSALRGIIKKINSDLIAVQEIVNKEEFKSFVKKNLSQYSVKLTDCGGAGKQKLGFLYKKNVLNLESFVADDRVANGGKCNMGLRPAAIARFKIKRTGKRFTAIAVHLKAGGRQSNADVRYRQYSILTEIIKELKKGRKKRIVVLGDFNTTDYVFRNQNYERFIDFADSNKLIDFSANLDCTSYWFGGNRDGLESPSVLDHILVTENFYDEFTYSSSEAKAHCKSASCQVSTPEHLGVSFQEVSDHCPVVAKLY